MLLIHNGRDEMIHRVSIFAVTAGLFLVLAMTGGAYAHGDEVHERSSDQADMRVPAQDRHDAQAPASAKVGPPAPMQDEGGHDHSANAGWADTGFERFLSWIGKLHPAATNFPIGLLMGAALAEAARVTRPEGRIAIVDFAAHQREELRDRHAHARLGFEDGQMASLLDEAGFEPAAPMALEDGELVVKIWIAQRRAANRKAAS